MQFGINLKNKNGRWKSFPTLHIFEGIQSYSNCGKVKKNDKRIILFNKKPKHLIYVVCEHCVYSKPNLRKELYS